MKKIHTNSNCLEGIACPECGYEDRFQIGGSVILDVTDDGADLAKGTDMEWDDDSFCLCNECNFCGTLKDFRIPDEELAKDPSPG